MIRGVACRPRHLGRCLRREAATADGSAVFDTMMCIGIALLVGGIGALAFVFVGWRPEHRRPLPLASARSLVARPRSRPEWSHLDVDTGRPEPRDRPWPIEAAWIDADSGPATGNPFPVPSDSDAGRQRD